MRITGGLLGGRVLKVPRHDVRPTQDRVRAALFSILAARVPEARFLDLFAGSGAVGLEAWSRGAAGVTWVEMSRPVFEVLKQNVTTLCAANGAGTDLVLADALGFLERYAGEGFDLVFADPPYRGGESARSPVPGRRAAAPPGPQAVLGAIRSRGVLRGGGTVILEQSADEAAADAEGWEIRDTRIYGGTRLTFLAPSTEDGAESGGEERDA